MMSSGSPSSALVDGTKHEAPVVGIGQSGEKRFRENEGFEFGVVRKFRSAPPGRFHDDMHVAIFRKARQVQEIRHGEALVTLGTVQKAPNLRPRISVTHQMVP
jgi:hypothetical protein